jgi:hypothetical protein
MKLLSEIIDDLECRVKRLEECVGIEEEVMSYGLIKCYQDYSLYFERITDTKDGFVIRDEYGNIIAMFPKSDE